MWFREDSRLFSFRHRTLSPEAGSFICASCGLGFHLHSQAASVTMGYLSRPVLTEWNQVEFPIDETSSTVFIRQQVSPNKTVGWLKQNKTGLVTLYPLFCQTSKCPEKCNNYHWWELAQHNSAIFKKQLQLLQEGSRERGAKLGLLFLEGKITLGKEKVSGWLWWLTLVLGISYSHLSSITLSRKCKFMSKGKMSRETLCLFKSLSLQANAYAEELFKVLQCI